MLGPPCRVRRWPQRRILFRGRRRLSKHPDGGRVDEGRTFLGQRARGYRATLVSGEVVLENGEPTGALPGKLVRGPQSA